MGKKYKHIFRQMSAVLCACILIIPMVSFVPTDGAYDVYDSEEDSVTDATGESGFFAHEQESESETPESSDDGAIPIESSDNQPDFDQKTTIQGVTVHVQAAPGVLPHDATLSVKSPNKVDRESLTKAVDEHRHDNEYSAGMYVFDISIHDADGNEIQPANEEHVQISFETHATTPDFLDARVYHFNEGDMVSSPTELNSEVVDDVIVAQSEGFSYYALDFVYNGLEYRLLGGESVEIQNILDAVGIQGNIFSATTSNPKLFSVKWQEGSCFVESHASFISDEWLDVVVDGKKYRIFVRDPIIDDPAVVQGGIFAGWYGTFAASGDIATIYIDETKIVNGIFSGSAGFQQTYSSSESGIFAAYVGPITPKDSTIIPGSFSYTFKNAAILQDGSFADVKITYSNIVVNANSTKDGPYAPAITFLAKNDGYAVVGNASPNPIHIGVQMNTTVEVVGASGTFYYNVFGLNNKPTSENYKNIVNTDAEYGWNERLALYIGDSIYIPQASYYKSNVIRLPDGRTLISADSGDDNSFNSGFVTLADASGVTATSWFASGGGWYSGSVWNSNTTMKTSIMRGQVTRKVTSSSGVGGRIDTNAQGSITIPDEALTKAGSTGATDTLAIPNGKAAIYTLTPDCGYILKSLTANGADVTNTVTPVKNADGKIEYYTYTLPANSSKYDLRATWQESVNIKVIKKIEGVNAADFSDAGINIGIYVGTINMPTAADGSIDNRYTQSLTNYALGNSNIPSTINYVGFIPLTSSPQEMITVYDLPRYTTNGQPIGYQANEFGLVSQGARLKSVEIDTTSECGTDIYTFTNEIPMVTLRIKKEVTGNAGDKTKQFPFHISYLNKDTETYLRDSEAYEVSIPLTVVAQQNTFSISVSEEHGSDYTASMQSNKACTINESYLTDVLGAHRHTFDVEIQNAASLQNGDVIELIVTNNKNIPIPTGLETGFKALYSIAAVGIGAFLVAMVLLLKQYRYKQVF